MQGIAQTLRFHANKIKLAILQQMKSKDTFQLSNLFVRFESGSSVPSTAIKGLENTTVAEILKTKGDEAGALYLCSSNDSVYDAVKQMTENRVGALVVVKPGDERLVAGIITERDKSLEARHRHGWNPRPFLVKGNMLVNFHPTFLMKNKLVSVSPDTNILKAMQLMTDNRIRHVPVIDHKVVGMISIEDVVRAVVEQQREEVKKLNEFIRGDYY